MEQRLPPQAREFQENLEDQSPDSWEKTLMLGKIEGRRRRGQHRKRYLDDVIDSMGMFEQTQGDSEGQGGLVCRRS